MSTSIVRGISQIAIAVKSLDNVSNWLHLFGADEKQRYTSAKEGVNALVVKTKFCNIEFLEPIINSNQPQSDDIVVSFIKYAYDEINDNRFIKESSRKLASMLKHDTYRLNSILRKLKL